MANPLLNRQRCNQTGRCGIINCLPPYGPEGDEWERWPHDWERKEHLPELSQPVWSTAAGKKQIWVQLALWGALVGLLLVLRWVF